MQEEMELLQEELEQAFEIVNLAWMEKEGMEVEIKIPPSLHHLTKEEWIQVCQILSHLMWQQERSPIH